MKNKSVRTFYKRKSILEIIIQRLKDSGKRNIFVLTTENSPKTQEQADRMGVKVFIGDEDDVHDRFCSFVIRYQPEGVLRICADNPFVALGLMYPIESWGKSGLYDYVSYTNAMLRHEGLFCEYISEFAITDMKTKDLTDYDKTHVTPYIYNNTDYRIQILPIPPIMNNVPIRLTVDSIADFRLAQKIYRVVGEDYWGSIYNYVFDKPTILKEMSRNIGENHK
jgi:spore coat polysaccharide biosynthesis protein SpsF